MSFVVDSPRGRFGFGADMHDSDVAQAALVRPRLGKTSLKPLPKADGTPWGHHRQASLSASPPRRAFAFHLACVNLWRAFKDAPAEREWRVTCSCKERIGYVDTFAEAEGLGREHVAGRKNFTRGRHVITLVRK